MKKIILIIALAILVAGISGGIVYFAMNKNTDTEQVSNKKVEEDKQNNKTGTGETKTVEPPANIVKDKNTTGNKTTSSNLNANTSKIKDYEYVFTTNGNAILKSTTNTSSPDAEYKVKCEYCGNMISNSYRTFRFSTNWEFPQTQEYSEICTSCKKTTTAEVTCQRIEK